MDCFAKAYLNVWQFDLYTRLSRTGKMNPTHVTFGPNF